MTANKHRDSFVIIGAGNLASHLASALKDAGFELKQIVGRTASTTKKLARKLNVPFTIDLDNLERTADFYILCVNDDNLHSLAKKLRLNGKVILHTSGSVPLDVLSRVSELHGVLYPLYTFNANDKVDFSEVPFFIEGSNNAVAKKAKQMALALSNRVHVLSSYQRERLHLAAVVTSNFSNYLFTLAAEFLTRENAPAFKHLLPLIKKTVNKLERHKPQDAQTGPAKRNDKKVIAHHRKLLSGSPELRKVYELLSSGIQKRHNGAK